MFTQILWVVVRSIVVPYIAYLFLKDVEPLGEKGAVLSIAIALVFVTVLSVIWNFLKILGNTLLLRGQAVVILMLKILIQVAALLFVIYYYLDNFTDTFTV